MSARTPLFSALHKGSGPSRRTVLKGMATAAVLAQPGVAQAQASGTVAVVGAGLAGLTAADRLRAAGVRCLVFDAQRQVGGRVRSVPDFLPGIAVELGGELINTSHVHMRALVRRFGLRLDDYRKDDPALTKVLGYVNGRTYRPADLDREFPPLAAAARRDRNRLGDDISAANPVAVELDRLSITQWLDRHGFSGWLRELIEIAYTTEMGLEPGEQSSLNMITLLGTDPDGAEPIGDSDERFHIIGGNDQLPKALAAQFGDDLRLRMRLEAVRRSGNGYLLTFADGSTTRADAVVLAIPLSTLRDVQLDIPLHPLHRRAIDEAVYGTNAKLILGFGERLWRTRYRDHGDVVTDERFQVSWDTSRLRPGPSGVLTTFTGGRRGVELGGGTVAHQARLTLEGLDKVFPGLARQQHDMPAIRFHWPSNPHVRGSYLCYTPGQWTTLRGVLNRPAGRVFFAGEHCSLENQGYMEGAAESGLAAANAVLHALRNVA